MSITSSLNRRWAEIILVAISFVVLALAGILLVRAGSVGWENGLLFTIASLVDSLLPGNRDVPVVIFTGILFGWLLLFFLDATKRVQTVILLFVLVPVLQTLSQEEHIIGAVGRETGWFLLSVTLCLVITFLWTAQLQPDSRIRAPGIFQKLRLIQFPAAAYGLLIVLTLVILVIAGQYPFMPTTSDDPSIVSVFTSALVAIAALSVFVQYTSSTDVLGIIPDGVAGSKAGVYTIVGLYDTADREFLGTTLDTASEEILEEARSNLPEAMEKGFRELAVEIDRIDYRSFDGIVRFEYLPTQLLRRRVKVTSATTPVSKVTEDVIDKLEGEINSQNIRKRIEYSFVRYIKGYIPSHKQSIENISDTTIQLQSVDTVLIIVPYPDQGMTEVNIERMAEILLSLEKRSTLSPRLVITHVDRADIDSKNLGDKSVKREVMIDLEKIVRNMEKSQDLYIEEVTNDHLDKVYPVLWELPYGDREGFEHLLDNMSS